MAKERKKLNPAWILNMRNRTLDETQKGLFLGGEALLPARRDIFESMS
jgi:hypothetical protein